MKRAFLCAALALAATHADAAARAHKAAPRHAAPIGLSIGKTALPGVGKGATGHRFGAVLPTGNCNPNFVPGQVPPAATWNSAIGCAFPKAGGTLQGPLGLPASTTATAPLNVPPGTTPTTPSNGDIWATNTGLFVQSGGSTIGPLGSGGGGGSNTSFLASGNYVNVPAVTVSANQSLSAFVGPNVLLKNYGSTQIIYHAAGAATSVTIATADGVIEPGATQEIALGTNAAIAVASVVNGSISGTGSVQVIDGSGLWTGSGSGATLPAGAATQTTLAALLAAVGAPLQAGGTVNVGASALPAGAATSALQSVFIPTTKLPQMSATTGGASQAVTAGSVIKGINKSAFPATCSFGATDGGDAEYAAPGGGFFQDTVPAGVTQLTCTGVGGTAVLNLLSGTGLGAGSGGGGGSSGGSSGNVTVVAVPPDASQAGSTPISAADSASTTTSGNGGQPIVTGSPTAGSVETFSLNTYQGLLVSARGTFSNTTLLETDGTLDPPSTQIAGTALWFPVLLTVSGQTPGTPAVASSFNGPFESAGVVVGGLQGFRCRVKTYTASDSITCTVRTTLTDPANALAANIAALTAQNALTVAQNGTAMPSQSNAVCGTDGTNCQPVSVTSPGVGGAKGLATQSLPAGPIRFAGLTNTVQAIKSSAGIMQYLYCTNNSAAFVFVQVFNAASGSVTLGTTPATQSFGIPPNQVGGLSQPIAFSSGMSLAATLAATGSSAPGTPPDCNVGFN